jgi:hypothetical protein
MTNEDKQWVTEVVRQKLEEVQMIFDAYGRAVADLQAQNWATTLLFEQITPHLSPEAQIIVSRYGSMVKAQRALIQPAPRED